MNAFNDPFDGLAPVDGTPVRSVQAQPDVGDGDIEITEDGVARAFTARFGDSLRYDHNVGKWHEFDGNRWAPDERKRAFNYCRELSRRASVGANAKERNAARKASFAGGAERFAQADPVHAVTQDVWDRDPFLMGAPGVTIDLRTGEVRAPNPADLISRCAAVAPSPHEDCPRWFQFLEDATGGDEEVIRFLRMWFGYCLTGDTREHTLVFIHGDGGNGKSVFLSTVAGILGDYAQAAAMSTFVRSSSDRHPTDLAALRGARMVTASETDEGRAWDEARIKVLTGGDEIAARFMRQDFFRFRPQFKLTIVGNHQPALSNVDQAMRRRFLIVPFTRKPARPDPQLEQKLKEEWPGILRWAINGCLDWQEVGLNRPEAIVGATEEYFSDQDLIGQWLDAECDIDAGRSNLWATSKSLFESWSIFARAAGEDAGTNKRLGDALARKGLRKERRKLNGATSVVWQGISLKQGGYSNA